MFEYAKLRAELRRLKEENEELARALKQEKSRNVQWDNLLSYTGKPQEGIANGDD